MHSEVFLADDVANRRLRYLGSEIPCDKNGY